ncbi:MAG: hypothetical protein U0800_15170 [Isosphaeraceae bacterium]
MRGHTGFGQHWFALPVIVVAASAARGQDLAWTLDGYRPDCGVELRAEAGRMLLRWPIAEGERARLAIDPRPDRPLVEFLEIATGEGEPKVVLKAADVSFFLTEGSRESPPDRPPSMSVFNVFFDSPANRPHASYKARLDRTSARVFSRGRSATVALGGLSAGPFRGELHLSAYPGCRLIQVEAVVTTDEDRRAFLYDAGLSGAGPLGSRVAWIDTEGTFRSEDWAGQAPDRPVSVRHRAIAVESEAGSVACFPPPHQYFFPRDLTDNQHTAWFGRGHRGSEERPGFGIRQTETGGGRYVPWFNAPPGTEQRLGMFLAVAPTPAHQTLREVLRFTHGDRFADLPGFKTFSSHWHLAAAVAAMKEKQAGGPRTVPSFVGMFGAMNVQILHLAEFHGDGHPQDPGPLRLGELEAMFDECRRLSNDRILFLPGEEANVHLGPGEKVAGRADGHWLYLFPGPVYWTMQRAADQPFVQPDPRLGTVYHVGNRDEMARLIREQGGLAWTAHPRIKSSNWAPDHYRDQAFYRDDSWLGAAWKAMPADLSRPKLGERSLDLLDDMANWGGRKQLVGEVDVFQLDPTHELYGHMNINYLKLDRIPRFDDGWRPVLDALRQGHFFTTTGEVLIEDFRVDGRESGSEAAIGENPPEITAQISWTFPPRFAEIISGDGTKVYRQRIDLSNESAFGRKKLAIRAAITGHRWVRLEAWDVAANGAFTQPVWLVPAGGR